jgi:hypothetical protein
MQPTILAAYGETFKSVFYPASTPTVLFGIGFASAIAALSGGVVWLFVRRKQSRLRAILALAPIACAIAALTVVLSPLTRWIHPNTVTLLLLVPALSLLVAAACTVWIGIRWKRFDHSRCGACNQQLLDDQVHCPECGADRRQDWGRRLRAATAFARLALVSAAVSMVVAIATMWVPLEWRARLIVSLVSSADVQVAEVEGEARVRIAVSSYPAEPFYGEGGFIQEVFNASASATQSPSANATGVWVTVPMVPVLPPQGVPADEAWFASLPAALAALPEPAASCAASWARFVSERTKGVKSTPIDELAVINTSYLLILPSPWVFLLVAAVGPLAALLVWLVSRGRRTSGA